MASGLLLSVARPGLILLRLVKVVLNQLKRPKGMKSLEN